jgi:hypothetical protein
MTDGAVLCDHCLARSKVGEFKAGRDRILTSLEPTGRHSTPDSPPTNYTYFKCAECGQNWMMREDMSVRGPARYLSQRPNHRAGS